MFNCAMGHVSQPRESMNKVVIETRKRIYVDEKGEVIGRGFETAKEITLCPLHAKELKESQA